MCDVDVNNRSKKPSRRTIRKCLNPDHDAFFRKGILGTLMNHGALSLKDKDEYMSQIPSTRCLPYHAHGFCFANCKKAPDHRPISADDLKLVKNAYEKFINDQYGEFMNKTPLSPRKPVTINLNNSEEIILCFEKSLKCTINKFDSELSSQMALLERLRMEARPVPMTNDMDCCHRIDAAMNSFKVNVEDLLNHMDAVKKSLKLRLSSSSRPLPLHGDRPFPPPERGPNQEGRNMLLEKGVCVQQKMAADSETTQKTRTIKRETTIDVIDLTELSESNGSRASRKEIENFEGMRVDEDIENDARRVDDDKDEKDSNSNNNDNNPNADVNSFEAVARLGEIAHELPSEWMRRPQGSIPDQIVLDNDQGAMMEDEALTDEEKDQSENKRQSRLYDCSRPSFLQVGASRYRKEDQSENKRKSRLYDSSRPTVFQFGALRHRKEKDQSENKRQCRWGERKNLQQEQHKGERKEKEEKQDQRENHHRTNENSRPLCSQVRAQTKPSRW